MSRTQKQWNRQRTGAVRRGTRPRGKDSLPAMVQDEYGWQPGRWEPERMWLQGAAPADKPEDGEPTRAVRSFSLTGDDDS